MEGVRTTAELLSAGLSAGRIRRLVRDGVLDRLRPGVYAPTTTVSSLVRAPRDQRTRQAGEQLLGLAATLAVASSRSAGSHRSAALVYGLGLVGRGPESDSLWRRHRTIGEADGAMKYETPARARAQLERDARLRTAGYEVVHFTWPEITRAPAQVVDAIQLAFRRSGAR